MRIKSNCEFKVCNENAHAEHEHASQPEADVFSVGLDDTWQIQAI